MRDPVDDTSLTRTPTRAEVEQVREEAARGDLGRRTAQQVGRPLFRFLAFRSWRRTVQLVLFARANGLEVEPFATTQHVPGIAGVGGDHAWTRGLVRWTVADRRAHVADHHWGYNAGTIDCRYLAVDLGVELPGMTFLCGRAGIQQPEKRFGPETFVGASYSLRVGGLAPDERARTLFTDELVALLTERDHPTNAEVVDGWFVGYVRRSRGTDPDEWRHAFAVAEVVTRQAALFRS